jgi:2-polyprenyl-6-hydroxyphenyl methylase/3-demethylubiquinone-9 3-methyltransferase
MTAEQLAQAGFSFDLVLVMEVVEHVANVPLFLQACSALTSDAGLLILSTPNRNWLSYLVVIVAAEYLLRLIPVGMHTWSQFLTPEELYRHAAMAGLRPLRKRGFVLNPFLWQWHIRDLDWIDYIVTFAKE